MSFFANISEIFDSLSPRRPRRAQPDYRQRSDADSLNRGQLHSPRREPRSPSSRASHGLRASGNKFSLGSDLDDNQLPEPGLSPNDTAHSQSYANNFVSSPGPTRTRRQLRSPPSQLVIDLTARGGDPSQMLNKDQRRNDAHVQARQEEARLLGARDYKDKNAVPITPGASLQKNRKIPGSTVAFRPTDRISQHARDSGPVRASGNSKTSNHLRRNPPHLDDAPDFEESNRPNKRRRQDDHARTLDLTDGSPVRRASSPSSQNSARPKSNGWARQHEEFRGVEDSIRVNRSPRVSRRSQHTRLPSVESQEERFTSMAAEQRRAGALKTDKEPQANKESERPRQALLDTIEKHGLGGKGPSHQNTTSSSKPYAVSGTRESPDELQGETTTQPVPRFLDAKQPQSRHKFNKANPMSPARKRSPTDIQPTDFAGSPPQGPKKIKRTPNSLASSFDVISVRYGSVGKGVAKGERAAIQLAPEKIELGEDIFGPGKKMEILLRNVRTVLQGVEPSLKLRLKLSQKSEAPGDNIDIEFLVQSDKKKFVQVLQDFQIKTLDKTGTFMDKAFTTYENEMTRHGNHTKEPFLDISAPKPAFTAPAGSSTRQKLSSALQNSKDESSESKRVKNKTSTRDDSGPMDGAGDSRERPSNCKSDPDPDPGVEIPVKPFRPQESAERETRSTRRTTRISGGLTGPNDVNDFFKVPRQPSPKDDAARKKWKKPLVYPWVGKKKAEVCVEDRDRLRDDEFLNDNLIGFYMRFLQDHLERTNKKAAERVYFFNSYFFDTLLNTPKGERGINYSGVEKWTRSVDLFSYDYIVVPINQAAHWYVAIICNLPSLKLGTAESVQPSSAHVSDKETSNQPESDVHEILESPEPEPAPVPSTPTQTEPEGKKKRTSESPVSQGARQSFASMTIQEQEKAQNEAGKSEAPADTEEWPEGEENPASPPAKFSPFKQTPTEPYTTSYTGRKTKKGKAGPKLSPSQTTIVTFDSLDQGRSPTIRMLRDYICKEAASKRGVEVDPTNIKGMRARQIPLQPNYSDCGLYLLAYVEKFVQDPDSFVTKLLSREMDQVDDWPPLGSGLLRHRLRKFLDDLYDEQAQAKDISEGQAIMADQQPISYLLGPPLPRQADGDEQGNAEHSQPKDDAKNKGAEEKPAAENAVQDSDSTNDGSAADLPELVPTASPGPNSSKGKKASGPPPADEDATLQPAPPKDEEVFVVPDSQENRPAPEPKTSRAENKKTAKAEDAPVSRKSDRKKAAIPVDSDVMNVNEPTSQKPAKGSQVQQIQVRRTPPPSEPDRVRKSPRGKTRKD